MPKPRARRPCCEPDLKVTHNECREAMATQLGAIGSDVSESTTLRVGSKWELGRQLKQGRVIKKVACVPLALKG